jgi:glycosyltransferase involved in cell wall biosynthesis
MWRRDDRPMNVLIVTPQFFPHQGGVETHVYEVGRRLVQRGIDLTILTSDPTGTRDKTEVLEGMHILCVRAYPARRDLLYVPEIARVIARSQWDLIHCQGCHTLVPPMAMRAARRAGIPYVLTFHSGGNSSRLRNALRTTQWWLQRSLFAGAGKLIGVSAFEANYFRTLLHLPSEQFTVIPNGSQIDAPATLLPLAASADAGHLIISLGRLERYKGHHRVIDALPTVLQHYHNVQLLILGGGSEEIALRRRAARIGITDHVAIRAIPATERGAMAATLAQAQLVTLLSDYESHPLAVMEALALRRPVLVTDTSGLSELAEQGLVRAIPLRSSPTTIGQAIIAQLRDPLIPSDFPLPSWDDCADQLLSVYHAVWERARCES